MLLEEVGTGKSVPVFEVKQQRRLPFSVNVGRQNPLDVEEAVLRALGVTLGGLPCPLVCTSGVVCPG